MRPDHINPPRDKAVEAERAAAYARKQQWKELPGNRYTPEELREMGGEFADAIMLRPKRRIMHTH